MFQFSKNAFSDKMETGNDISHWSKSEMFENGHEYIYKEHNLFGVFYFMVNFQSHTLYEN